MRIKVKKKGFAMLLSLLLILSTGSLAFASSPSPMKVGVPDSLGNYLTDGSISLSISPRDVYPIDDVYYQSSSTYDESFSVDPSDGKKLNVYVANLSDSGTTVTATLYNPDGNYSSVVLSKGQQKTWTSSNPQGMSGTYRLTVTENTGDQMHIHVNVRQF